MARRVHNRSVDGASMSYVANVDLRGIAKKGKPVTAAAAAAAGSNLRSLIRGRLVSVVPAPKPKAKAKKGEGT